jgi:pyrimidine-nucleoside phosphorylase
MKEEEDAIRLAKAMVAIGNQVGRKTVAVISDMSQPLGYAVGNALEVEEAIHTLKGEGPVDLTELSLTIGAEMLLLSGKYRNREEARETLEEKHSSGEAQAKFRQFLVGQGGDPEVIDDPTKLPQPKQKVVIPAIKSGYISNIHAEEIGLCAMRLGAGRATKADTIDFAVGVMLHRKVGDAVKEGEALATLYVNREDHLEEGKERLLKAIEIGQERVTPPQLIRGIVTEDGYQKY